jgi:hypothetical protein
VSSLIASAEILRSRNVASYYKFLVKKKEKEKTAAYHFFFQSFGRKHNDHDGILWITPFQQGTGRRKLLKGPKKEDESIKIACLASSCLHNGENMEAVKCFADALKDVVMDIMG